MLGTEAGHVSEPNKKKAVVVKSKNEISEAQIEESTAEFNRYHHHRNNGRNVNLEENKGDERYEDSGENPEDMMEEEPEEDPEEEIYEEYDEGPEDVIYEMPEDSEEEIVEEPEEERVYEEIDGETEEDPEEEIVEEPEEEHMYEEIDGEPEEDPEEEIVEEPEEDPEEEISEESCEESLAVENCHLSSAMSGDINSKNMGNEPNENPEEERGKKVVEESGSEPMSNFINRTMSSHTAITRTIKDQHQHLLDDPVLSSSMTNACAAGYQLKNALKMGSLTLEACGEAKEKFLNEEYLKSDSNATSAVGEHDGECASEQQVHGRSSGKRRQSRWDLKQEGETPEIDGNSKRRKTRWDKNDSQNGLINLSGFVHPFELLMDPMTIRLKAKLMKVNKKLQSSEIHDEGPPGERSPSPEPVYNNLGLRINTCDARIRLKLTNKRNRIICELAKLAETNLTIQSPAKHKPTKLVKKVFVPVKEYPSYNFIGLILGPKGNTQKKMEKETGAKILLRGKGSGDPESEDDDLHVRVEAYNQEALDAAVVMIEKLLIPVADQKNDHKRAQLVELAKLRGTYKDNICDLCKEQGHKKYACPLQDSTFKAVCCDICGSFGHLASSCNVSTSPQISKAPQGSSGVVSISKDKSNKEMDQANLYVGYLTHTIDEKRLKELFLPFGKIIKTAVIKDHTSGLSKGYGFVLFENPLDAAAAIKYMNGYKMDGKMLAVRVAGQRPVAGPLHPGHVPAVQTSMLSEAPFTTPNNESLSFPHSSTYSGHNINVARTQALSTLPYVGSYFSSARDFRVGIPSSLPDFVSQFPGHPDYLGSSQFTSFFTGPAMNETQNQMPETAKSSSFLLDSHFP